MAGVPVLFYTPETRFGFGATALCLFNFKKDSIDAPRSTINLGFAYTQNNQMLFNLPFNLFINNRAYQFYGEAGYNRFFYNFYGIGNDQSPDFVERYGIEFPRVRLTVLKKIKKHFFAGLRYAFDSFELSDLDSSGQLIHRTILGSEDGVISGFGTVFLHDSRDFIFYPSKGTWAELVIYRNDRIFGGTFNYTRMAFDMSHYFSYKENILALNLYSIYSNTDLPFFQMANLGGVKKMRGFYEGRYRDNNLLVFQAEYRRHIYWIFGATVFAGVGQVAKRYDAFNTKDWRYTYGVGLRLRLDKKQRINLRVDVAVGNNKVLPYFTIAEAF